MVLIFWKIKSEDYLYKNLKLIINSNQQAIINSIFYELIAYIIIQKKLKILLVEDNLLNQKVVSFHLRKFDYDVVCVGIWRDAMEEFKNNPPDLILMDIMLPEKNGFEITADIRKYEMERGVKEGVPIIALTANTLDNDKDKCLQAGMNDYLPKPFSPEELYTVIEQFTTSSK
jgi:osomolarity two-component system sensor histidine kinase NIK1